jgi:hypothetical protein
MSNNDPQLIFMADTSIKTAMLQRFSRLDTRAFYFGLLTSIHLPAPVDLIGEECVYGRHSLDTNALERNQVTHFVQRHLILMREAPWPPYCRTLLLLVTHELLGGVLSRNPGILGRSYRSWRLPEWRCTQSMISTKPP